MTLKEKLQKARDFGYTLKFIAEQNNISPNTLYAFMGNREYNFSNKTLQILENFLDTLNYTYDKIYTVYIHKNKINNKVYVGLTSVSIQRRWKNGEGYNKQPHFYAAIKKYGWDNFEHIIIKTNLTREEASLLEEKLIEQYDSLNPEKGYNKREGGIEEYHLSEEQRRKRGESNRGKKRSKEFCDNLSQKLKGRQFSEETKTKMREAKLIAGTFQGKNNPKARKVICLETKQIFNTLTEAALFCNLKSYISISQACRGISSTAGGYHWEYYDEYLKNINKLENGELI